MKLKVITYRTLMSTKEVFETLNMKATQWVICENNVPTYFVDRLDVKEGVNELINYLMLEEWRTMSQLVKKVRKQLKINLIIVKPSLISKLLMYEIKEFNLKPFPVSWLLECYEVEG